MPYILPDLIESADAAASTATAYSLAVGQTAQGTIAALGDHDWYRVSLVAGQTYTFAEIGTGTNSLQDTYLNLRDSSGNILLFNDDGGPGLSSSITYTATTTGTYYIDAGAWADQSAGQYGISATLGTHPNFNISMGAGAVDAYTSWSTPGTGATVTYGFRQSSATYTASGSNISTFTQVSAAEMAAVQTALQLWSDVAGITFQQVNPGGYTDNAAILIGNYTDSTDGAGAFTYYPGSTAGTSSAGDMWLNLDSVSTSSLPFGSYSFFTIMHELGHAIGLSHPGDYNAAPGVTITYANSAQFVQDTERYSVMSYFGGSYTGESPGNFATTDTPMMFDIYELQAIYGANNNTRVGNTVYGFGSNAGSSIYNFSINSAPQFCIWDAGGTDTINCSGYSLPELINLNAGTFSNIDGETANVSIALRVTIENATGGSGNDTIFGNSANNTFIGGGGNDTIDGGGGWDTTIFNASYSSASVVHNANGSWTIAAPGEVETLTNVEVAQFTDRLRSLGVPTPRDFNGDGISDLLWVNSSTGQVTESDMNSGQVLSSGSLGGDANWSVLATGDFNGDGMSDLLWRSSGNGAVVEWVMNDRTATSAGFVGGDTFWSIIGTGDFSGDGRSDILWRNSINGNVVEWDMNAYTATSAGFIGGEANWSVVGTGDFNGDGNTDLLWRNTGNGNVVEWDMNDRTATSTGFVGGDLNWSVAGTGDFNGDGKTDILWRNGINGNVIEYDMNDHTAISSGFIGGDLNNTVVGTGDYNGDGMSDILWRNSSTGLVTEWDMNDRTTIATHVLGGDLITRPITV